MPHWDELHRALGADRRLAADASLLAACSYDKKTRLYSRDSVGAYHLKQTLADVGDLVFSVALAVDASLLAEGTRDKKTRLYARGGSGVYTLTQTLADAEKSVLSVALAAADASVLVAASHDGKAYVYRRDGASWPCSGAESPAGVAPMFVVCCKENWK